MPVFDPGVPWLRGTATLTNGSTTVETDGVITLNEILEGDRLYVFDGGGRLGPFEIVGGEDDEIELREAFEGATGSYSIAIDRNPVTPLGAKILRDMSDVLGRIGNFGELSERDQISSDLIPIGPERDAIKDALDVTKRASNLADLTNLKEARSNLGTFSSAAEVQSRHIPAVLESIRTFGRNASGDGPPLDLVRGSEVPGAIQSADGQWWEDVGYNTITVRIPSQFPTLQAAIDHYSRLPMRQGAIIDLLIEGGHRPASGVAVSCGDFGRFQISAEASEVLVASDFTGIFLSCENARAPVLNCVIDLDGKGGFAAYLLSSASSGFIRPGGGVKNGPGRGLALTDSSSVDATEAMFTGFQSAGLHCSRSSTAHCNSADFSRNSLEGPSNTFGAVYASRTSRIHGQDMNVKDSGGNAIRAQRKAVIVCPGADVSGAAAAALVAVSGGSIYGGTGAVVGLNLQAEAVIGQAGADIILPGAEFSAASGNASSGIDVRGAGDFNFGLVKLSAFGQFGMYVRGTASVDARQIEITDSGSDGLWAEEGAAVNIRSAAVTGSGRYGVVAERGATVCASDATISGSANNDVQIGNGSSVVLGGASTTNGIGSPDAGDTNVAAFNQIDGGKGIIWA